MKRPHKSQAFILPEILISLALIMLFVMPFFYFLINLDNTKAAFFRSAIFIKELPDAKFLISSASTGAISTLLNAAELNESDGTKSCNFLFTPEIVDDPNLASHLQIIYAEQLSSNFNFPSSIDIMHTRGGGSLVFIGMNSASTTDADMLIFDTGGQNNIATNTPSIFGHSLIRQIFLGPGITNMIMSPTYIIGTERSSLTPIWKGNTSEFMSAPLSAGFSTIASSSINHTFPLSLRLSGNKIAIGSEKNINKEAYIVDAGSGAQTYGGEIGAGVNDLYLRQGLLYIASPKNPELEIYDTALGLGATTSPMYKFDAPGSNGNGKSLALGWRKIFLGRTIGNEEFIHLYTSYQSRGSGTGTSASSANLDNFFSSFGTFNLDESILFIMPVQNGKILILTTNDAQKAFSFLKLKSPNFSNYEKWFDLLLPATVEDFVCDDKSIIAVLKSTSTPVVNITFP